MVEVANPSPVGAMFKGIGLLLGAMIRYGTDSSSTYKSS